MLHIGQRISAYFEHRKAEKTAEKLYQEAKQFSGIYERLIPCLPIKFRTGINQARLGGVVANLMVSSEVPEAVKKLLAMRLAKTTPALREAHVSYDGAMKSLSLSLANLQTTQEMEGKGMDLSAAFLRQRALVEDITHQRQVVKAVCARVNGQFENLGSPAQTLLHHLPSSLGGQRYQQISGLVQKGLQPSQLGIGPSPASSNPPPVPPRKDLPRAAPPVVEPDQATVSS